jgi:hypothetical protein
MEICQKALLVKRLDFFPKTYFVSFSSQTDRHFNLCVFFFSESIFIGRKSKNKEVEEVIFIALSFNN